MGIIAQVWWILQENENRFILKFIMWSMYTVAYSSVKNYIDGLNC